MSTRIRELPVQEDLETLDRLLSERWSCRAFLDQQVSRADIERVLELAQRAASWCNTQPWELIITSGEGTERFRAAMQEWQRQHETAFDVPEPTSYLGIYQERRRSLAYDLYTSVGIEWGDRAASAEQSLRNFRFFDAPHVAILTVPSELGSYALVDLGGYISNFILAIQALGLGAIPQAALAEFSPQIRNYFDIPDSRSVVAGISFGHPDLTHPVNGFRTPRAEYAQAVRWVVDSPSSEEDR